MHSGSGELSCLVPTRGRVRQGGGCTGSSGSSDFPLRLPPAWASSKLHLPAGLPARRCLGLRRKACPPVPGPHPACPVTKPATCSRTPALLPSDTLNLLQHVGPQVTTLTFTNVTSSPSASRNNWGITGPWFLSQATAPRALPAQPPAGCHREHGCLPPPDCGAQGDFGDQCPLRSIEVTSSLSTHGP